MENGSRFLKSTAYFKRVCQVSVVRKGGVSFHVIHHNGLHVVQLVSARSAVSRVTDGNGAATQLRKRFGWEYIVYQA